MEDTCRIQCTETINFSDSLNEVYDIISKWCQENNLTYGNTCGNIYWYPCDIRPEILLRLYKLIKELQNHMWKK